MTDSRSIIGPLSRRRRIATAVAVVGVLLVGSRLARAWPRSVEVDYLLEPGVVKLDVDYLYEGEAVASARFRQPDPKSTLIQHTVRLRPGEYQARITVYRSDGVGVEHARKLIVPAEGLTRFDLKDASGRPE